jgi:hypothetical protein
MIEEVEPVVDATFCDLMDRDISDRLEAFSGTSETLSRLGVVSNRLIVVRPIVLGPGVPDEGISQRAEILGAYGGLALETS